MSRPSEPTLAQFYDGWGEYNRLLIAAVEPLDAAQLDLQAAPHLWSVRMMANHVAAARVWWFHSWMGEGGAAFDAMAGWDDTPESQRRPAAEIAAGLASTWDLVESGLRRWRASDLCEHFQRPTPNDAGERPWRARQWIVWHVMEHDAHHGGEISLTLGTHGVAGLGL